MSQLLVNVLSVVDLESEETVTLAHGLLSNGVGVAPTQVFPDRASSIVVVSADETHVTLTNAGSTTASANFRCEHDASIIATGVTQTLWKGAAEGGTPGPQGPQGPPGPPGPQGPAGDAPLSVLAQAANPQVTLTGTMQDIVSANIQPTYAGFGKFILTFFAKLGGATQPHSGLNTYLRLFRNGTPYSDFDTATVSAGSGDTHIASHILVLGGIQASETFLVQATGQGIIFSATLRVDYLPY